MDCSWASESWVGPHSSGYYGQILECNPVGGHNESEQDSVLSVDKPRACYRFSTVELLTNQNKATLLKVMKNINSVSKAHGFKITTALMDGEFEPLRGSLAQMGIILNTVSCGEHVPEAERHIRTSKERV